VTDDERVLMLHNSARTGGPAFERTIRYVLADVRLREHLDWHCGHGECEHVDVLTAERAKYEGAP